MYMADTMDILIIFICQFLMWKTILGQMLNVIIKDLF